MKYNKDYYENFAKLVLEYYFPDRFVNMQKGEKPDWYNESIGLEVTRALSSQEGKFDAFIKDNLNHPYSDYDKKLKKMGFLMGPTLDRDGIFYEQRSKRFGRLLYLKRKSDEKLVLVASLGGFGLLTDCVLPVREAIETKLKKLNSHYEYKKTNDLAILVQEQLNTMALQDELVADVKQKMLETIKEVYASKFDKKFNNIYVIFYDNVFRIDTNTFEFERIIIAGDEVLSLSKKAFETE